MNRVAEDVWIGIDLGTQSVRVIAVNEQGLVLGEAARSLTSQRNGLRHTQDPREWWTATCQAAREALAGVSGQHRGVSICGTSGTIVLVDKTGNPVSPGIMYDDGRAHSELQQVNEAGESTWSKLGYRRMQTVWGLPKLLWLLKQGQPKETRLAHQVDIITRGLAGHPVASDLSNALKSGCDLIEEAWPLDVFDALDIPADMLPALVRSGSTIGSVDRNGADLSGIAEGTAIISGLTDGCASQLSSGATEVGSWNTVLGTTLVFKGKTHNLVRDPNGVVYSHRAPDGGWLPGGASSAGAGALTAYLPGADLEGLSRAAPTFDEYSGIGYPLVSKSGERFPFVHSGAYSFLSGRATNDAEIYAELTRGMAAMERLCFDYLDYLGAPTDGTISLTGGASRSDHLNQLRSNMLGRELVVPRIAQPAIGMAVLAASSRLGHETASRDMISIGSRYEPEHSQQAQALEEYVEFVNVLESRGWLPSSTSNHARGRVS